jgi:DNA-binding transcriptional LysR family regulator
MITLRQLEIFASVVEHGSFRRCGEALGISQVSVSDHMRALEAQLGARLFERVKGGPIDLTAAGRRAAEGAQELLSHAHDLADYIVGETSRLNPLAVAMHGFMMRNLGPIVLDWNRGSGRQVQLRSNESAPEMLQQQITARELDIAYFYAVEGGVEIGEVVAEEPLAIFVSEHHPLAAQPFVTAAELSATPAISLSPDKPLRRAVDAVMAKAGVKPTHHVMETAEFGLILSSLHRGMGFTCMFAVIETEEMQTRGLKALRFEHSLPALQVRRITRRSSLRANETRDVVAMLERHLRS